MMDMSNIKIDFWGEVNIEKMFDIHDNQRVEIYASGAGGNNDNQSKASDNDTAESKPSPGARKQFLFIDGRATVENAGVKNREKERFLGYLSDHKMSGRRLVTEKSDGLNKAVVCFLRLWCEKGLTAKQPSGGAVFRFLTEDCGLKTDVTEASYSNKIKEWLRRNDYDVTIYQGVKTCF